MKRVLSHSCLFAYMCTYKPKHVLLVGVYVERWVGAVHCGLVREGIGVQCSVYW